jgi:hypothetical protein
MMPNHSIQRRGASRSGEWQLRRLRRLAPTADAGRCGSMESPSTVHNYRRLPGWIILATLLLYFLSFGPASRLRYRWVTTGSAGALVFETVYAPIQWLQHRPLIGNWIYDYVDLWEPYGD